MHLSKADISFAVGQVANYMRKENFKYGFLTTYDATVFFKQEPYTFRGRIAQEKNTSKLCCTHPCSVDLERAQEKGEFS